MVGDLFIFCVTGALLDCRLGGFKREDAQGIRKVRIKFVLFLKADLDVLTNVEVFIIIEIHSRVSFSIRMLMGCAARLSV
jgi:hypothetical protein